MPNWCSNNLYVSGTKKDVTEFKEKAKTETEPLSLNSFVPMPKEEEENWYEWDIANWGTKWDIADVAVLDEGEDYINYMFDTAWSPPVKWLQKVAKQYPDIEFEMEYREDGMGFAGKVKAQGDKFVDEDVDTVDIWQDLKKENLFDEESDEFYEEYDRRIISYLERI